MLNWFLLSLKQSIHLRHKQDLVESLAGGREGTSGVGQDPVYLLGHPVVECVMVDVFGICVCD